MANPTDEMIVDLIEQAWSRKIVFFVGAGISVPSGVLDFKRLTDVVMRKLSQNELGDGDYRLVSEHVRPEVMYQIAIDELGPEVLRSLEIFEGYEPNYYHYFLADAIQRGNWVFTTNTDNLIEAACERRGMKLGVDFNRYYGRGNDQDFNEYLYYLHSGNTPEGCIFKLHGSIEEGEGMQKYKTIQFALRQVGKGLFEPRKEVLEYFLRGFDFWFVGYSCRDDFSVFPVLSGTKSSKDVLWFDYDAGSLSVSIVSEKQLHWEIEREENKPLDEERDLGLININEVLLQRGKRYRFAGDLGRLIRTKLLDTPASDMASTNGTLSESSETFSRWARARERFERHVFLGRLFEQVGRWDRAIEFYQEAIGQAKDNVQHTRARERLADLYYRESVRGKEEESISLYEQCIDLSDDPLERANLKVSISNVQRRRGRDYLSESYAKVDEARREFESILAEGDRDRNIDYARCLNVYGLILYSMGKFEEAREQCQDSVDIKQALGDVDGAAESENAISLTHTQEGRKLAGQGRQDESREKFLQAITHARRALAIRRKIGNYRGYAQNCRNLAWPYSELMKSAANELERQDYFREARSGYKGGISSWNRFAPPPPIEIVLFNNLLAGLYIDFCSETEDQEQKTRWAQEIVPVYKVVFGDPLRKQIARSDRRVPTAEQNLKRTKDLLRELSLFSEEKKAESMLVEL